MRLGLIAGNGTFPFLVLDAARRLGHAVTIIAVDNEASPDLEPAAAREPRAECHRVPLGHLGRAIELMRASGVTRAVMAGQVKHTSIFSGAVPDRLLLSVLLKLRSKNTDAIISAVADVLRDHGIELVDSTSYLTPLLAREGVLTSRQPTDEEREDFAFGYRMADAIAGLDIGQTIAVKSAAVVAVEAMEGTDAVIAQGRRAGGAGRADRQGGQAQPGHALRRAGRRRGHHRGDAGRRRHGAVGGCRAGAPARRRRRDSRGGRGGDVHRGPGPGGPAGRAA